MVYFECDTCNETLKKKQVLGHYSSVCRRAHLFSCLTCFQRFDRDSIVAHTSCVSEEEKYQKGDSKAQDLNNKKAQMTHLHNLKDDIDELDFKDIAWKGFQKTTKEIVSMINVKKVTIPRLVKELTHVYAKYKKVKEEDIDIDLLKTHLMDKIEHSSSLIIDLSKNQIRLKLNC